MTPDPSSDQKRDATSLRLLGGFFMVLGLAVLAGSFWELDKPRALTVNVAASLVLIGVGAGMLLVARRLTAPSGSKSA